MNFLRVTLLLALCAANDVLAEHRAALIINSKTSHTSERDVAAMATRLEKEFGFHIEMERSLNREGLNKLLGDYSRRTPIRGTALVFYRGAVRLEKSGGKTSLLLCESAASNAKGLPLSTIIENLDRLGGSQRNIIVLDAAKRPAVELEIPESTLVVFSSARRLAVGTHLLEKIDQPTNGYSQVNNLFHVTGLGSKTVSPPRKLIEGKHAGDEWVNPLGMVFCWCPEGSYMAGSPSTTPNRYPDEEQHHVEIESGFWISKYEVTIGGWIGKKHSKCLGNHKLHPINMISQSKDTRTRAIGVLNKAQRQSGDLPDDWEYALPTEDQWEYAARAGSQGRFYFGESTSLLPRHANFADKTYYDTRDIYSNSAHRKLDDGHAQLAKVGSYAPNSWGLHDMYGNVAEWCQGAAVRGGGWISVPENCRSAYRDHRGDRDQQSFLGCRFIVQRREANASHDNAGCRR